MNKEITEKVLKDKEIYRPDGVYYERELEKAISRTIELMNESLKNVPRCYMCKNCYPNKVEASKQRDTKWKKEIEGLKEEFCSGYTWDKSEGCQIKCGLISKKLKYQCKRCKRIEKLLKKMEAKE